MTKRIEVARAPALLEEYCQRFDPLLGKSNQRQGFWQYLEGQPDSAEHAQCVAFHQPRYMVLLCASLRTCLA